MTQCVKYAHPKFIEFLKEHFMSKRTRMLLAATVAISTTPAQSYEPIVSCMRAMDMEAMGISLRVNIDRQLEPSKNPLGNSRMVLMAHVMEQAGGDVDSRSFEVRELPRTGLSGRTRMFAGDGFDLVVSEERSTSEGIYGRVSADLVRRRVAGELTCRVFE
jgi:hypothetical protein